MASPCRPRLYVYDSLPARYRDDREGGFGSPAPSSVSPRASSASASAASTASTSSDATTPPPVRVFFTTAAEPGCFWVGATPAAATMAGNWRCVVSSTTSSVPGITHPYLNVGPGTMNPVEHGEVFVTHDGAETDLDLGYYERFAGIRATKANSTSSGQLFQRLLERERKGDFLGKTVQMVPHFTDERQAFSERDADAYDVVLCEIGGSVGDSEAMAFYEALCRLREQALCLLQSHCLEHRLELILCAILG